MAVLVALLVACGEQQPPAPNVLLISIDTLRADHLGCYGYERPTSPFLDGLAESGVRFARCLSQAPNTAPSHMTVMTSLHPTAHGVPNKELPSDVVQPEATTHLAELLAEAGYATAGFTDGGPTSAAFGFGRGFDVYDSTYEGVAEKVDRALGWLDEVPAERAPFFLFVHTYEVHAPYLPPPAQKARFAPDYDGFVRAYCFDEQGEPLPREEGAFHQLWQRADEFTREDVEYLVGLYDGCIAHTDAELERLVEGLQARGVVDDTLIVVLSDHGEEFGEHGSFSHKQLHREVLHVPLLLAGPGVPAATVVTDPVGLIDVAPTVLDLLGIARPAHFQGLSLRGSFDPARRPPRPRPIFSEHIGLQSPPFAMAVEVDGYKLLERRLGARRLRLFDVSEDPGETESVTSEAARPHYQRLRALLERWQETNERLRERHGCRFEETGQPMPDDVLDDLRALGYGR